MKRTKIIVTGGAGFIGSHLTDALINKGFDVTVIDNLSLGKKQNINPKAKFYKKDIKNLKQIEPLFKNIDYVFHLAAQPRIQPSIINPIESHKDNVDGTLNVLTAARNNKVKKLIYSASSSVYGDQDKLPLTENMDPKPKNPYALFKLIGEKYCKLFSDLYKLPTVCLRYFNVYGPRQISEGAYATVIGIFLKQKKQNKPLTIVGDGKQTRDFTHVKDIVRANLLAMKKSKARNGEIINIGTGKNYTINQIAKLIEGKTKYIEQRPGESRDTLASIKKAKEILSWEPKISIEQGIEELKKLDN
ncbi:MAG: NAD-dependent epimerase/dehydratase family protein [Candidatus Portnoybacteria bacterium]|nr:NAD-dependent epimerase/dehydratase family protein [Candidatus Portnoybacteria bacterium]